MASDLSDMLVQSGAGFVAGVVGFGFAYALYRMQRRSDRKESDRVAEAAAEQERITADNQRTALLTYLAAEVRRNFGMTNAMRDYCRRAVADLPRIGIENIPPYRHANLSDHAYHACLGNPQARMDQDKALLDALVDCYSGVPTWQSIEASWYLDTHSGEPGRVRAVLVEAAGMVEILQGQADRFLRVARMLRDRGIVAQQE